MELFSLSFFAVAIPAVVFAGVSKGGFGSGAAFASAAILALVVPPDVALGLMLPLLMLIDLASLPAFWRKWDWPAAWILLLGAVPGTVLGAVFFAVTNADAIRLVIGAVAIGFVVWQAAVARGWVRAQDARFGARGGLIAGAALGFASFVSHAGGPAAAVYLLGQGLTKTTYQATTVLVFWAVNLFKAFIYGGMGMLSAQSLWADVALAPFAILGAVLGIRAHHWVSERVFFSVTYVALFATGLRLIWVALTP